MSDELKSTSGLHLLEEEHRELRRLMQQTLDPELSDEALEPLATTACAAWTRLAQTEEESFFPCLQAMGMAPREVQQALLEHQLAAQLVTRLGHTPPKDPSYRAAAVVLGETVTRHLDKVEKKLFPLASALDLSDIAARLGTRRKPAEEGRTDDGRLDVGSAEDRNPPLP